jgi:hypothetical protein
MGQEHVSFSTGLSGNIATMDRQKLPMNRIAIKFTVTRCMMITGNALKIQLMRFHHTTK